MIPEACPKCKGSKHCWSQNDLQLECQCKESSCNTNGTCCEASCLSCDSQDAMSCVVCKKNIVGKHPRYKCVESCPHKTYEVLIINNVFGFVYKMCF